LVNLCKLILTVILSAAGFLLGGFPRPGLGAGGGGVVLVHFTISELLKNTLITLDYSKWLNRCADRMRYAARPFLWIRIPKDPVIRADLEKWSELKVLLQLPVPPKNSSFLLTYL
jgi:hypothetical protein